LARAELPPTGLFELRCTGAAAAVHHHPWPAAARRVLPLRGVAAGLCAPPCAASPRPTEQAAAAASQLLATLDDAVCLGLDRIVALHYCSSALYQIH
jgi:hypothetical protein